MRERWEQDDWVLLPGLFWPPEIARVNACVDEVWATKPRVSRRFAVHDAADRHAAVRAVREGGRVAGTRAGHWVQRSPQPVDTISRVTAAVERRWNRVIRLLRWRL